MSKESLLPNRPKALGLGRRWFLLLLIFSLCVIGLFFTFLSRYSSTSNHKSMSTHSEFIEQSEAQTEIQHIRDRKTNPILIAEPMHSTVQAKPMQDRAAFEAASNASISVYQKADSHDSEIQKVSKSASTASLPTSIPTPNPYAIQNQQDEKLNFLNRHQQIENHYLQLQLTQPRSRDELLAGTIIPATLVTAIQSDLPGTIIAKVKRDVFDTVSGNDLLIPQGTTLIGVYDSKISYGQSRVLMVWSRLIFPNGSSIDLRGMPGVDLTGMAGLHDLVNHHYFRLFSHALLMSVFGVTGELLHHQNSDNNYQSPEAIINTAIAEQVSQTAIQSIQKNMNVQPTINIRPGTGFNVLLTRDMVLPKFIIPV